MDQDAQVPLNFRKNYLEKFPQVNQITGGDWNSLEYRLQLNLGNASAKLKRVYQLSNQNNMQNFAKDNKGWIQSESYIRPQHLTGVNRIERVCHKGFQFPSNDSGIEFTVGQIDINPQQKVEHQLLLVKIYPKRSYPCDEEDFLYFKEKCPPEFDSIYFHDNNLEKRLYRHRFRLFKKQQVLPCYLLQFTFNAEHEKQFKEIICQDCQNQVATIYCSTENVYFCQTCDYGHHKDKISARHIRAKLAEKPVLDFGMCRYHPKNKNELFCKTCNLALCLSCKVYGDHSKQSMKTHQYTKIQQEYKNATEKIEEKDPNLSKRKTHLQELLDHIDEQIDMVNDKTRKMQRQLKNLFEQYLQRLENLSKRKLSYLMSDQLEVLRQYHFIEWMESFLKYEFSVLPPNDFIMAWAKHQKLRKDILNISYIPAITEIGLNMEITGELHIQDKQTEEVQQEINMTKKKIRQKILKGQISDNPQPQLLKRNEQFRNKMSFYNFPSR